MALLLTALGASIVAYIVFVMAVPKAVPTEDNYLRAALDRLSEENRASEEARTELLRDQLSEAPPLVRAVFSLPMLREIYEAGLEAGFQNNMQSLLALMLATFGAVTIAGLLLHLGVLAPLLALPLMYLAPLYHCKKSLRKRNQKFIDHFPDALDMIVRSVRSGFPLSVALQMLAENAEEPVRSEFRQVADEVALGRTLNQALARLATRVNEPDIRFFVVVLTVQQETGGNLAEVIGNLSSIIRKRKQIRHKIRALTSEGKATGWVLGLLPVFVFGVLYCFQPNYLDPFFYDAMGRQLLGITFALLVTCYIVVKNMIEVEI